MPLVLYIVDRLIRRWRGSKDVEIIKVNEECLNLENNQFMSLLSLLIFPLKLFDATITR